MDIEGSRYGKWSGCNLMEMAMEMDGTWWKLIWNSLK